MVAPSEPSDLPAQLRAREDIPNEDIPAIIERAAQLQAQAEERALALSPQELEKVAEDVGIDGAHVETAIVQLREERIAAREQATALAQRRTKRAQLAAGVGALALVSALGVAWSGASSLAPYDQQLRQTEALVETALERQEALLPGLLSLVGGNGDALRSRVGETDPKASIEQRLNRADELNAALAAELTKLDRQGDPEALREFRYELIGAQNRISTEARRWRQAKADAQQARESVSARVAIFLGMAEPL